MKAIQYIATLVLFFASCKGSDKDFDATGSFEADETIISSEVTGQLKDFVIKEGEQLKENAYIGYIDTVQLFLKKKQLEEQIKAVGNRVPDVYAQTNYFAAQESLYKTKLHSLSQELERAKKLVNGGAAGSKQIDDIQNAIDEVQKQMAVTAEQKAAQVSALTTQAKGLKADPMPLFYQIQQINDQLSKSHLNSPMNGIVLTTYVRKNELLTAGKPIYKIADLSTITLRVYITESQLVNAKIGQAVRVFTDDGKGGKKEAKGTISWISSKAEFTPKTIQTKEERTNLVYAVKVAVANDGSYKIGMYGEIKF